MENKETLAFDLEAEQPKPHAFIQWKGTDVCMDFWCECGAQLHHDGYFAYVVQCPHCNALYQMPSHLYPRRVESPGPWHEPKMMEIDEDYEAEARLS